MNWLKNLQINALVSGVVYIVLGILFIVFPQAIMQFATIILAVLLALAGIVYIISYFRRWQIEYRSNGLAIGIMLLFGALFILLQREALAAAIPLLLGFAVALSGTIKLQNAIVLNRAKDKLWIPTLVMAAVSLILGGIIMFNPFAALNALIVLIGVSLLFSGVTDLVTIALMSRRASEIGAAGGRGGKKEK